MTNDNTNGGIGTKSKIKRGRSLGLFGALATGMVVAGLLGENSPWLLFVTAAVAIVGLGTSNLFQSNKELHYKEGALLTASYASAAMLGVSLMQINAWLPEPIWAQVA